MKVRPEVLVEYKTLDPETQLFFEFFDEPEGSRVLEIGAHDAPIGTLLAKSGFKVTGVDLRPCDQPEHPDYFHIKGDFCALPPLFWAAKREAFDSVIAVSSLEHFGLCTYNEGAYAPYYDVVASRYAWDALREGGTFYVVVPFGGKYVERPPHWRVYDWAALSDRIVQDFTVDVVHIAVVEEFQIGQRTIKVGEQITWLDLMHNTIGLPYTSVLLKLRKGAVRREAKDK